MGAEGMQPGPGRWAAAIKRIEELGHARDGVIVILAFVYICGFLSWAIYSATENIGFVRIFDAQYLIGGILPSLSFAVVIGGWELGQMLPRYLRIRLGLASIAVSFVFWAWMILFDKSIILKPIFPIEELPWEHAILIFTGGLIAIPLFISGLRQVTPRGVRLNYKTSPWVFIVLSYSIIFIGVVFMIRLYITVIYPGLPQEFGGPKPRRADLILERTKGTEPIWDRLGISPIVGKSEKSIFPNFTDALGMKSKETVVISDVQILYSDDKVLILKPPLGKRPGLQREGPTSVEVRKEVISAIIWYK